ncbi:hypothetical protein BTM21_00750 [Clostridium chauvoei]|nr:hypothetical protein BTM20_12265 [Clostridium chauvoei]ATD58643.1 hypothetical protein BTM21_00750 [Clostridium chauvoei]
MESRDINTYLKNRNIKVINKKIKNKENINEEEIANQINLIVQFHKFIGEYRENIMPRIGSTIGKDVEDYKVQLKKLTLDFKERKEKKDKNEIDLYIISNGENLLNKGNIAINHIIDNNYKDLIKRSMINYEVCLGRVDESNLKDSKLENFIEISTVKYLSYNLIEHDLYNYIKKLKKKFIPIEVNKIIDYYVDKLGLSIYSKEYLRGLIYYPNESLKVWEKYILNKKNLSNEEYLEEFKKAQIIDGIYSDGVIGGDFFDK